MDIAKSEIGVKEIPGAQHNQRILDWFHRNTNYAATSDEDYWCAAFVSYCLEAAGYPSAHSARARDYETYGVPGDGSYGDIVVYWRGSSPSNGAGHVGFVDRVEGNSIYTLGGNQSNAVNITRTSNSKLLCYRRPAGNGATPPPPPPNTQRPTLKRGSKGAAVKEAQGHLNRHGAHLNIDGDFGPKTEAATRNFQEARHIGVDGIIGPITWSHLLA